MIREFGLFHVLDDANEPNLRVEAIHDERGYRKIQRTLARQYDIAWMLPDIQVVDVNLAGDRRLILHHRALNRVLLEERDARFVLQHLADLWGYDVLMKEIDPASDFGIEGARGNAPGRRPATRLIPGASSVRGPRWRLTVNTPWPLPARFLMLTAGSPSRPRLLTDGRAPRPMRIAGEAAVSNSATRRTQMRREPAVSRRLPFFYSIRTIAMLPLAATAVIATTRLLRASSGWPRHGSLNRSVQLSLPSAPGWA